MSMKYIMAFVALVALMANASAYLVNAGNYIVDVNYIVMEGSATHISTDSYGMHFEGEVLNIFPNGGKAYVGTVTYLNGTSPDTVTAVQGAAGFALGAMGNDLEGVTLAIDSAGRQNVVTNDAAAKVGLLTDSPTLLVVASNYEGGIDVVSYITNTGVIAPASKANEYRASSF